MLVSISEGFCLEGLFGAILFSAAVDILAVWRPAMMCGGAVSSAEDF